MPSRRPSAAPWLAAGWATRAQTFGSITVPRTPAASLSITHTMPRTPNTCSLNSALSWASVPWPSSPLLQVVPTISLLQSSAPHFLALPLPSLLLAHRFLLFRGHGSDVWCLMSGWAYMWWRVGAAFIWRSGMGLAYGGPVVVREVARVGWIVTVEGGRCIVGGAWRPGAMGHWLPGLACTLVPSQLGVSWSCPKVGRMTRVVWVTLQLEAT